MEENRRVMSKLFFEKATRALKEAKKHSGVISFFRHNYIKSGKLDESLSDIIKDTYDFRHDSDYNPFYIVKKSDVEQQVKNAEYFVKKIREYLDNT